MVKRPGLVEQYGMLIVDVICCARIHGRRSSSSDAAATPSACLIVRDSVAQSWLSREHLTRHVRDDSCWRARSVK